MINNIKAKKGYFVLSFDTEMAWGYFDKDKKRESLFSENGQRERTSIKKILALCEKYGVRATWAIVGHLFHKKCEECTECPILRWEGNFSSYKAIYKTNHSLWYAPEIIELLVSHKENHEIAFHGYTHSVFTEMTEKQLKYEVEKWKELIAVHHLNCSTIIFPRNKVAYLGYLQREGFKTFRGSDPEYIILPGTRTGALIKIIDYLLTLSSIPIYSIDELPVVKKMVDVRSSAYIFDFNRRIETAMDTMGMYLRRVRRLNRAIEQAATQKKMVHLWAHPWEFRTEYDFKKLEYLLASVKKHVDEGRLQSVTMGEITNLKQ